MATSRNFSLLFLHSLSFAKFISRRKTILSESSHIYPMERDRYDPPKRSFKKKKRTEKPPKEEKLERFEEAQPEINLDEWEFEDSN